MEALKFWENSQPLDCRCRPFDLSQEFIKVKVVALIKSPNLCRRVSWPIVVFYGSQFS